VNSDLAGWVAAVRSGVAAAAPDAGPFAQHVSVLSITGSTSDDVARAALDGAPEGYTVIAAEQTAGRGRRGASWHSPATCGLYLSTLLRPERWPIVRTDPASPAPSLVTLMAGVAVISAIADVFQMRAELKWPNDVMVRGDQGLGAREAQGSRETAWRKLAGILAEGASEGGALRHVVLGIGVNLQRSDAPADVAARMIALDESSRCVTAPLEVLPLLVSALLGHVRRGVALLAVGAAEEVRTRWREHAPSAEGTVVRWLAQGEMRSGRSAGIDDTGALRVRLDDGTHTTVHGGELEWCLEDGER
jgi:BirA family transcriptional regulator, biotin operon repressor / biotin---[acetyl-CoA-carboxylase] ligase